MCSFRSEDYVRLLLTGALVQQPWVCRYRRYKLLR